MRKQRRKYKVCARLGYNPMLRKWFGKTKKWEKHVIYFSPSSSNLGGSGKTRSKLVNPLIYLTNEKRLGRENLDLIEKPSQPFTQNHGSIRVGKTKALIRRKNLYGRKKSQQRGRKRRYGNLPRHTIQKERVGKREKYKTRKQFKERSYRKGESLLQKQQSQAEHRRSDLEARVDVRRWRAGRVPSIQRGRDRIEHGFVFYREKVGNSIKRGSSVQWQGDRLKEGQGRCLKEERWKKRKPGQVSQLRTNSGNYQLPGVAMLGYREVDYVSGSRIYLRDPRSHEVRIPKGRDRSLWSRKK